MFTRQVPSVSQSGPFPLDRSWPLGEAVRLAGLLEASAPKAGNVHPGQSFDDMHFMHFVVAADCIASAIANGVQNQSVGALVFSCVEAMREQVGVNTSLGTILLFVPLAKARYASPESDFATNVAEVLESLVTEDSHLVYQAIANCMPGGIGEETNNDIRGKAPDDLLLAMSQVAEFDAVARQYVADFTDVFQLAKWLDEELPRSADCLDAICRVQVRWLSLQPDGLIIRKLGQSRAVEVLERAQTVNAEMQKCDSPLVTLPAYQAFDTFLRSEGNRLNPGTTADLIAAMLLVKLLG